MNTDILDDSQVSEISIRSLFNERNPEWKEVKEERLEPFYPMPKTRNNIIDKVKSAGMIINTGIIY